LLQIRYNIEIKARSLWQSLHELLNLGRLHLQVFVPFEFRLNRDDILGVADLTVMRLLEILLELV